MSQMGITTATLPLPFRMQDLVLPGDVQLDLELITAWVRHRHKVLDTWGFAKKTRVTRGLKAVFAGSPGTGKTMAAQCLASELGVNLIRVDLFLAGSPAVVDSERSLEDIFEPAGESSPVLLFDGADNFLGKSRLLHDQKGLLPFSMSDVLEHSDRYDGLVIFTAREACSLKAAFGGRFNFVLEFPLPGEEARRRIWEGMFPEEAERAADLDFRLLAGEFEITGEEIRNAVLAAAFLAASADAPIGMEQLRRAVHHTSRVRPRKQL